MTIKGNPIDWVNVAKGVVYILSLCGGIAGGSAMITSDSNTQDNSLQNELNFHEAKDSIASIYLERRLGSIESKQDKQIEMNQEMLKLLIKIAGD